MQTDSQQITIGNPVDVWWNTTRQEIVSCIDLLAQFPPAPNSMMAGELIMPTRRAYEYVLQAPYPPQASKIREFLLESLDYLLESLKEQMILGLIVSQSSHNMAYHKYLMVTFKLLQRGIYEPTPAKQTSVA